MLYSFRRLLVLSGLQVLKGSWDLVTRVIIRVTILITPIKVLITLLTKSHDPPSRLRGPSLPQNRHREDQRLSV